jgi:hypothetical protein
MAHRITISMLAIFQKLTSCESARQAFTVVSKQLRFSGTQTGSNAVKKN